MSGLTAELALYVGSAADRPVLVLVLPFAVEAPLPQAVSNGERANAPAAPAVAVTNPRRVKAFELGIELSIDESGSASSGGSDLKEQIRARFRRVDIKLCWCGTSRLPSPHRGGAPPCGETVEALQYCVEVRSAQPPTQGCLVTFRYREVDSSGAQVGSRPL